MVRSLRVGSPLLLVLLVALPGATAEPAGFELEGTLPLEVSGSGAWGADGAAVLFQSLGGDADWRVTADRVDLVHVEYWQEVRRGDLDGAPHSGVRTEELRLVDADLHVAKRLPGFTALVWSEDRAHGAHPFVPERTADLRVFRLGAPLSVTAPALESTPVADTVLGRPVPFRYEVAAGTLHAQAPDGHHGVDGAFAGYLAGAELRAAHADGVLSLPLTESVETRPGSVYVPGEGWTGPGSHEERVVRYIQFTTRDGGFSLDTGGAAAAVFAPVFDLGVEGRVSLAETTGTIRFDDGTVRTLTNEGVSFAGAFDGTMTGADDPGRAGLTGRGDVAYLRAAGVAETFDYGVAATAVGAAALLAVAVAVWKVAGGAGITLFSRVSRSRVLDHETRAAVYALVKAQPGCTPNDLVGATGIGWSTVMYHLGVLERNELVVAMKDGRYRRFFDRESGRFANGRKKVVSALKNGTTAEIARLVRDEPGQVQRRLAERFGLAASSVHWHVMRLVDAGLVEKRRAGQRVELFPGPAWDSLDEELASVLTGSDGGADVPESAGAAAAGDLSGDASPA